MKTTQTGSKVMEYFKSGFFKGVGLGAGLLATSIFAAAAAMNVFSPGETLSSAKMNQNFAIAAPEGAIMAFYLASCPEGWAPADGTNGTPDLRGQFIRGRDDIGTGAGGNDPSGARAIGNLQLDAFQGHRHGASYNNITSILPPNGGGLTFGGGPWGLSSIDLTITDPVGDGTNGAPRTAGETRPKNVALTYCMRHN
ncbi:MAG: tail fiber protein [Spirochaetia bacterium]|nr:tail fiber protein [Spirochaetia bacterium]